MNPLKILSAPEYLRIAGTPLYTAMRALTLKRHVAAARVDCFTQYDFISSIDFKDALDQGYVCEVAKVGPDLVIQWNDSIFVEAERLTVLEARNAFRRDHGLQPVTLDDCFLSAGEAAAAGKKGKRAE